MLKFSPGTIVTDQILAMKPELVRPVIEKSKRLTPLKRVGNVLDIAKGVAFLSSSDASFITGANLVIDGGLVYNLGAISLS